MYSPLAIGHPLFPWVIKNSYSQEQKMAVSPLVGDRRREGLVWGLPQGQASAKNVSQMLLA